MLPGHPVPYHLDQWITGQYAERQIRGEKLGKCTIETIKVRSRLTALNTAINYTTTSIAESMRRETDRTKSQR